MATNSILIDAHVHFYPCYERPAFFAGAQTNFARAAEGLNCTGRSLYCLLLSETAQHHYFETWWREADGEGRGDWQFRKTAEDCSLGVVGADGSRLAVIAGRQIVTAEGLEVLALGCRGGIDDGQDLQTTLAAAGREAGLTVLPWAFGKWWFARGRLISAAIEDCDPALLCLGDNGGRPRGSPTPRQFAAARARGYWILPGTDPLPLPKETDRAGGYGFALEGVWDAQRPFASVQQALRSAEPGFRPFGARVGPARFLLNQVRIRL